MQIYEKEVLDLFGSKEYISSNYVGVTLGWGLNLASKRVNRMFERGLLVKHPDIKLKFLPGIPLSSHIREQLIRHWKENDHPGIRCIPVKHGGTVTGGSGQWTMLNYVIDGLVDLELII